MTLRRSRAVATALGLAAVGSAAVAGLAYRRAADPPAAAPSGTGLPGRPVALRSSDGTTIAAHVVAPTQPRAAVVLAHGWTMSSRFWHHQVDALSRQGFHVVAYDQRGHGASGLPADGDHSCDALAADLDAVVEHLVPDSLPLGVVGHSLGAMSVLAWAAHPQPRSLERLRSAVLFNTGVHQLLPESASLFPVGLPEPVATRLMTSPVPLPPRSTATTRRITRAMAHGLTASPEAVALTEELFLACPASVRAGFGRTLADLDLRHAVSHLHVPTLVVGGERDRLTPIAHARRLARQLPSAELVELEGSGHQSPLELPDRCTELIRGHLDATCAAPAA